MKCSSFGETKQKNKNNNNKKKALEYRYIYLNICGNKRGIALARISHYMIYNLDG